LYIDDDIEPNQHYFKQVNGFIFRGGDVNTRDCYLSFNKVKGGTHALWKEFFCCMQFLIMKEVTDKYPSFQPVLLVI
jgi:hypothetical protein